MYKQLDYEITLIDSGLMGDRIVACYLLESEGEVAIIETGNINTTERILSLLNKYQINKKNVRYIIPTHVHLDHAGGAGSLLEVLPDARLVIHPHGARHMIDPTILIAGATAIYGKEKVKELYSDVIPVPENKIIIAADKYTLTIGNRTLLFRDTPGHANHHFCIWDEYSSGWFTGDTFGIAYPSLDNANTPFIIPSTTPVQFNASMLIETIEKLMSYQPKYMYLTHFGVIKANREICNNLILQIRDYVTIAESLDNDEEYADKLKKRLMDYTYQKFIEHGGKLSIQQFVKIIEMDIMLNSYGLQFWKSRQKAQ